MRGSLQYLNCCVTEQTSRTQEGVGEDLPKNLAEGTTAVTTFYYYPSSKCFAIT